MITTPPPRPADSRTLTLIVLGAYVSVVTVVNVVGLIGGRGSAMHLILNLLILAAVFSSLREESGWRGLLGDWLPLIALPVLYAGVPWTTGQGRMFDEIIQEWDRAMFATDPARTFAGAMPSRAISELLHFAYLSYYAIIYLPPVVLYVREGRRGFAETVFAFTVTMVATLAAFSLFPVEGPRYAWPAPAGVPEGPVRSATLFVLEHGSSRGTAFPSSHMAIAMTQTLSLLVWRPAFGAGLAVATVLLGFGAVYGGFHYAADILVGAGFGVSMWLVARRAARVR